jgi:hypothetical protein
MQPRNKESNPANEAAYHIVTIPQHTPLIHNAMRNANGNDQPETKKEQLSQDGTGPHDVNSGLALMESFERQVHMDRQPRLGRVQKKLVAEPTQREPKKNGVVTSWRHRVQSSS